MTNSESIERFLDLAGEMLRSDAVREAPVREGRLRGDITVFPKRRGEVSVGNTTLIDYAKHVYYGTGIYGRRGQRIVPKRGKALKTPWGYRTSVAGQRANPYLDRALESMVSSGRLDRLLDGFVDEMDAEIFDRISAGLQNIRMG